MAEFDWHAERSDLEGLAQLDRSPEADGIDLAAVRTYRQERVRRKMSEYGVDAVILSDPVNIRYATGTRNMQVFSMRNAPSRYLLMTLNRSILFEFTGCLHLAEGFETVDEVRPARTASFVAAGPHIAEREKLWAAEMADLIHELTGSKTATIGLERLNAGTSLALKDAGLKIVDAQQPVEMARAIKSREEMKCVIASLRATEIGVGKLREAIRPGLTEAELWSVLHQSVIAQNGDYVETRLLNAGARTNPWFQEASASVIGQNDLIALDTDVVGCHGYYADFSRTFHSGPDKPSTAQRELYKVAFEQLHHNMDILHPGMTFRQYADKAWNIPEKYYKNRYYLSAHGVGMTDEYPKIYYREDWDLHGYDGVIEADTVMCVESFVGSDRGGPGVKLEQMYLVTERGTELLSRYPIDRDGIGG